MTINHIDINVIIMFGFRYMFKRCLVKFYPTRFVSTVLLLYVLSGILEGLYIHYISTLNNYICTNLSHINVFTQISADIS